MAEKGYPIESQTVEEFALIHVTGDIVPVEFFQRIKFPKSGKPDLLAILILSDLLYWYRPIRPRSESTGKLLPWRQKFFGEILRRDYSYFVEKFGATDRQCRDACARLKKLDLIEVLITPTSAGGSLLGFRPKPDAILDLLANPDSRLNVSREKADSRLNVSREKADSRLNVSRLTFKRESSINTLDFLGETSQQQQQEAAAGSAAAAAAAKTISDDSAKSRHSRSVILRWIVAERPEIKNPGGLATIISRSVLNDEEIQIWLEKQAAWENELQRRAQAAAENQKPQNGMERRKKQYVPSGKPNIWDTVLFAIEKRINHEAFATWFYPTSLIAVDGSALTVKVPDSVFEDWILNNYRDLLEEAIDEAGISGCTISFESEAVALKQAA